MRYVLGVDPGLSGALALYDPATQLLAGVWDMPIQEMHGRRHLDHYQLAVLLDGYARDIRFAVIEEVSAMPGQGVTSMFRFGQAAGTVAGIIAAHLISIYYVRPAVWKALTGLTHEKNLSRELASRLFPKSAPLFARKKDDGRAEAAILAHFGASRFTQ